MVVEIRSRWICRAVSGSSSTPSNRFDSWIAFVTYAMTASLAQAAFCSVSGVMYVDLIHSAVAWRCHRSFSSRLTRAIHCFASSEVGFGGAGGLLSTAAFVEVSSWAQPAETDRQAAAMAAGILLARRIRFMAADPTFSKSAAQRKRTKLAEWRAGVLRYQRPTTRATAFTISWSDGNPMKFRWATTFPSTSTWKLPPEPSTSSASIPSSSFSAAAARTARGS